MFTPGVLFAAIVIVGAALYLVYRKGLATAIATVEAELATASEDVKATIAKIKATL